ncbi:hypothetical protein [Helicobacter rodentium]|nr:hypothetical protein [Helicobacter rodentium]
MFASLFGILRAPLSLIAWFAVARFIAFMLTYSKSPNGLEQILEVNS